MRSDVELLVRSEGARLHAPEGVRERVLERAGSVREPRFVLPPLRRLTLVAAPVVLAGVAAAAIVNGIVGSEPRNAVPVAGAVTSKLGEAEESAEIPRGRPVFGAVQSDQRRALGDAGVGAFPRPSGRLTDYQATLLVRVRDLDRLTDATAEAVRIVRGLGGYAASVDTTTGSGPGRSYLELRVPAARVQDALLRLSDLGTVLSQQLSLRDLQNAVAQQNSQITALRRAIRRIRIELRNPTLPADVRVRLQIQLDETRRELVRRTSAKKVTLREAATAKVSLQLTTERNATALPTKGRFERSIDGAVSFLEGTAAVALGVLIGASPFLLLAILAFAGRRAWRRREEQRLLAAQ